MFSVIITHYGDPFWALNAIKSLGLQRSDFAIFILDNQGNFPKSQDYQVVDTHKIVTGSDSLQHGNALNWMLRNTNFQSRFIMVLDSDVMTFGNSNWFPAIIEILKRYEAIVALREGSRFLSHSCFAVFPVRLAIKVDYTEGLKEFGFDTGTLVGLQLKRESIEVAKVTASRFKNSPIGYSYSEINLIHLTSSSLGYMKSRFKPYNLIWRLKQISRRELAIRLAQGRSTGRFKFFFLQVKLSLKSFGKNQKFNDCA